MAKRKNPYKQKLIKEFGEIEIIEPLWKSSMSMARKYIGGKRNKFKQPYSELALYFSREKLLQSRYGGASFYSFYQNAKGTEAQKIQFARREEYANRTKELRRKYGEELITYNGQTKTLNDWFKLYEKDISHEDMNEIIEILKEEDRYKDYYNTTPQNASTSSGNK